MSNVIDVSPALLQKVRSTFEKEYRSNIRIKELYKKIQNGSATYVEADDFAVEVGSILANAFGSNLSSDVLPDGKMYYNIAKAVVEPMMVNNYDLVSSVAQQVQTNMNKAAGVGIKAIVPELNQDRVDGIINGISTADNFDTAKWRLGEPIVIFSQSIIIDSIRENAKFQYDAGLGPKIVRQSTGKCCDWCNQVVGSYEYPDVPKDVYKRHDYCRCKVDYVLTRYRRNVHNNNKGKRRYVQDEYGGYVKTKEARIEKAKQMQATEKSRKEAARQKRIETWKKKKSNAEKVEFLGESSTIKETVDFAVLDKQFGKKVGKHAKDFGLNPALPEDRERFTEIIQDIRNNATEQRIGPWRGQPEDVIFYIKEEDVVLTKQNGEFITVLTKGINNVRVKNARIRKI